MITLMVPKRSAIAPANGWATPYSNVCRATENEKISRHQPLALDNGVRNRPSADRGPNPSIEMRQPHTRITVGVRQLIVVGGAVGLAWLPCIGIYRGG